MKVILAFVIGLAVPSANTLAACKSNIPGHDPSRFIVSDDGTVLDQVTGLMWMSCDLGAQWDTVNKTCVTNSAKDINKFKGPWVEALNAAAALNEEGFASYKDWRVPNIKELASTIALNCVPAVNATVFPDSSSSYWTSTPSSSIQEYVKKYKNADNKTYTIELQRYETTAWSVTLSGSVAGTMERKTMSTEHNVRLVRFTKINN